MTDISSGNSLRASDLSPSVAPAGAPPTARVRLDYLDGVRALAAIYVCLFHAMLTAILPHYGDLLIGELPGLALSSVWAIKFLRAGHFAVSIFIVLSGYCLMLPVTRQRDGRLPGGVAAFLGRRARRVLLPYYAALGLSMLMTWLIPGMKHPTGTAWTLAVPIWDRGILLSHLLLFQNWSQDWYFKIDPVAWSMATEAQIYLIFAFVLLPLTRRVGVPGTTALALWAGLEIHWYFNGEYDFVYWSYVGLFSLGMLGAAIGFSAAPWAKYCRERLSWGALTAVVWALVVRVYMSPGEPWMQTHMYLADPLIGVATFLLLVFCTQALAAPSAGSPPFILRVLEAKPLVRMGSYSYSLYLVHYPVLVFVSLLLQPLALSTSRHLWVILGLCIPVCAPVAYLFYRVFEVPGLRSREPKPMPPQVLHARATEVAEGPVARPSGRWWLAASLASAAAVVALGFYFADRPHPFESDPAAARAMQKSVGRAIAVSDAIHPATCKVLFVPDEYGSLAVSLGLQLARAGEPFVVTGGRWKNTFGAQHAWASLDAKMLRHGLAPWYIRSNHRFRVDRTSNAQVFPLRDEAVLLLTSATLELSAAGSTADIDFTLDGNSAKYALGGWSNTDAGGTWTEDRWAAVAFHPRVVEGSQVEVFVDGQPFLAPDHGLTKQRLWLYFNGTRIEPEQELSAKGTVGFTIPAATWNGAAAKMDGQVSLAFEFPDAVSPASLGPNSGNDDARTLGLFVSEVRLRVAP